MLVHQRVNNKHLQASPETATEWWGRVWEKLATWGLSGNRLRLSQSYLASSWFSPKDHAVIFRRPIPSSPTFRHTIPSHVDPKMMCIFIIPAQSYTASSLAVYPSPDEKMTCRPKKKFSKAKKRCLSHIFMAVAHNSPIFISSFSHNSSVIPWSSHHKYPLVI